MSLQHDLQYAAELARSAGGVILEHYGKVERLTKTHAAARAEAVTETDRASQRLIVAGLRRRFPNDGIIGEESESGESITFECPDPLGRNWVIDPIDGTNNFIAGLGIFAVCIALMERGVPILGVVYDVTRDLMYTSARGLGAWLGNERLTALDTPLSESSLVLMTSNLLDSSGRCPVWAARFITQMPWKVRILGSAAIEASLVAAGVAHAAITVNGKLWDVAAPTALVMESGGVITDLRGNPIFPFDLTSYQGSTVPFLAGSQQAHQAMLAQIIRNP